MVFLHHRPNMKFSRVHLAFKKKPFSLKNTHPHITLTGYKKSLPAQAREQNERDGSCTEGKCASAKRSTTNGGKEFSGRNVRTEGREVGGVKGRTAPRASSQFLPLLICLSNCAITGLIFQNPP